MPVLEPDLELRPATMDDAVLVAELETARMPDEPRDDVMLRFWWSASPPDEKYMRLLAEQSGAAVAFVAGWHAPWEADAKRFGSTRAVVHPDIFADAIFEGLVTRAESWLLDEQASIAVARVTEGFSREIELLERRGYREVRRGKRWELDLVSGRERLLAGAEHARKRMKQQGVQLLTLDQDRDPDGLRKLYDMAIEAEGDIPTTVPWQTRPYDEWQRFWFDNPSTRKDRFWMARDGDGVVGLSVIGYPPNLGVPWTFFTGTSRRVRGQGVARALKYETVAQAITLGVERLRTNNDGENAPILHLNEEMGYYPIDPLIELHRDLG